jgi:murein DD-endopeptidase MepM/ murein hydrolase activator NlpD
LKTKKVKWKVIVPSMALVLILALKWYSLANPELSKRVSNVVNSEMEFSQTVKDVGKVVWKKVKAVFAEKEEKATSVSSEKTEAIELLSFDMGGEEILDDTEATDFPDLFPKPLEHQTPVSGRITSAFGTRVHPISKRVSKHTGLDIGAPLGTPVLCYADGVVVDAGKDDIYGNYVRIDHANNVQTFYGHNSKLLVKKGQKVKCGTPISLVGSTGLSTGPHLHFEILVSGKRQDPAKYIKV